MFEFRRDILLYQLKDAFLYWIVIPFVIIITGKYVDRLFYFSALYQKKLFLWPASVFFACGLVLIYMSTRDLRVHGHGTPNKRRPAKSLVTHGTYSICRHPMFLGYDLVSLAIVLFLNSKGMLLVSYPVFICFQVFFLLQEEQLLAKKFRTTFPEYKRSVPFLIPFTHWKIKQHDPRQHH